MPNFEQTDPEPEIPLEVLREKWEEALLDQFHRHSVEDVFAEARREFLKSSTPTHLKHAG